MYKVFFNENLIVFTEKPTIMQGFHTEKFIDFNSQFFLKGTIYGPMAKIQVICDNLENDWKRFLLNFKVRKAAGGVVENEYNELLWIYRFDKWDLPKGHIEAGESKEIAAIREVEEECGISQLNIKKELETTYHIFKHKEKWVLKISYWFLMSTKNRKIWHHNWRKELPKFVLKTEAILWSVCLILMVI